MPEIKTGLFVFVFHKKNKNTGATSLLSLKLFNPSVIWLMPTSSSQDLAIEILLLLLEPWGLLVLLTSGIIPAKIEVGEAGVIYSKSKLPKCFWRKFRGFGHISGACLPCGQFSQRVGSQTLILSNTVQLTCAVSLLNWRYYCTWLQ